MSMRADEFYEKRAAIAEAFGVNPHSVPAETVWHLVWPQPEMTDADRERIRKIFNSTDTVSG